MIVQRNTRLSRLRVHLVHASPNRSQRQLMILARLRLQTARFVAHLSIASKKKSWSSVAGERSLCRSLSSAAIVSCIALALARRVPLALIRSRISAQLWRTRGDALANKIAHKHWERTWDVRKESRSIAMIVVSFRFLSRFDSLGLHSLHHETNLCFLLRNDSFASFKYTIARAAAKRAPRRLPSAK